jgi:S-adenosylmethionine-diacylglycerol 3-amino-3-carboxypropyl transferase
VSAAGVRLLDRAYQRLFSKLFVYNILYEDSEVDEAFLGVDGASRVLGIAGAGCGVANHLSAGARSWTRWTSTRTTWRSAR